MKLRTTGEILRNGAEVVAKSKDVVLAVRDGVFEPFVTWAMNDRGDTFWGHYFSDEDVAVSDFAARVARGY